jgi:hypothetical protein
MVHRTGRPGQATLMQTATMSQAMAELRSWLPSDVMTALQRAGGPPQGATNESDLLQDVSASTNYPPHGNRSINTPPPFSRPPP